jgi:uncharacterized lipoprotein YddW (UPF0748 family)
MNFTIYAVPRHLSNSRIILASFLVYLLLGLLGGLIAASLLLSCEQPLADTAARAEQTAASGKQNLGSLAAASLTVTAIPNIHAGSPAFFSGTASSEVVKVSATLDGFAIASNVAVSGGEYSFLCNFNTAGSARSLVVTGYDASGAAVATATKTIAVAAASSYKAMRGVWLTTVGSTALNSKQNIVDAMNLCVNIGINAVFVAVWGDGVTLYPSGVMQNLTGVGQNPAYTGRDPLREVIDAAHARGIKVFAWFEYGFIESFGTSRGAILTAKPHWAAKNSAGQDLVKDNFYWMNALHPEVQSFMNSLITELVGGYDVDGIQGDDHLCMPVEGGYDTYTVNLYKQEKGVNPPSNTKDAAWIQWRAGKITAYISRLFSAVKTKKGNVVVAMSPGPFPWSRDNYLQDWPTWMNNGTTEHISPQLYRYDITAYQNELNKAVTYVSSSQLTTRFASGVLLKSGTYKPTQQFLQQMIQANRAKGVKSEIFFFYEGLKDFQSFLTSTYADRPSFPTLY